MTSLRTIYAYCTSLNTKRLTFLSVPSRVIHLIVTPAITYDCRAGIPSVCVLAK